MLKVKEKQMMDIVILEILKNIMLIYKAISKNDFISAAEKSGFGKRHFVIKYNKGDFIRRKRLFYKRCFRWKRNLHKNYKKNGNLISLSNICLLFLLVNLIYPLVLFMIIVQKISIQSTINRLAIKILEGPKAEQSLFISLVITLSKMLQLLLGVQKTAL